MPTPTKKGGATAAPAKPTPGKALATSKDNPLAISGPVAGLDLASVMDDAQQQKGHGFQQDDLATPFLRVAQALSPEVNPRDDNYIDGCEVGMFIDTGAKECFDGQETGVIVIPVHHEQSFLQWKPRKAGGGLVKDWGTDASVVDKTVYDDKDNKRMFPDGTELQQGNKYFVIMVDPSTGKGRRMVFSLTGSQRRKAKNWNTKIATIQVPRPDGNGTFNPAMFYVAYEVKTVYEENDKGNWYGVDIRPKTATVNLPGGAELYLDARDFASLIQLGKVKVQQPVEAEFEITEDNGDGASEEDRV